MPQRPQRAHRQIGRHAHEQPQQNHRHREHHCPQHAHPLGIFGQVGLLHEVEAARLVVYLAPDIRAVARSVEQRAVALVRLKMHKVVKPRRVLQQRLLVAPIQHPALRVQQVKQVRIVLLNVQRRADALQAQVDHRHPVIAIVRQAAHGRQRIGIALPAHAGLNQHAARSLHLYKPVPVRQGGHALIAGHAVEHPSARRRVQIHAVDALIGVQIGRDLTIERLFRAREDLRAGKEHACVLVQQKRRCDEAHFPGEPLHRFPGRAGIAQVNAGKLRLDGALRVEKDGDRDAQHDGHEQQHHAQKAAHQRPVRRVPPRRPIHRPSGSPGGDTRSACRRCTA